jgi:hypothetical protein
LVILRNTAQGRKARSEPLLIAGRSRLVTKRRDIAWFVCIRCEPQALSDFSWRRCSRGGGRHELTRLVPGPREQFVDLLHRMVRQAGKDLGEPGVRIDVI